MFAQAHTRKPKSGIKRVGEKRDFDMKWFTTYLLVGINFFTAGAQSTNIYSLFKNNFSVTYSNTNQGLVKISVNKEPAGNKTPFEYAVNSGLSNAVYGDLLLTALDSVFPASRIDTLSKTDVGKQLSEVVLESSFDDFNSFNMQTAVTKSTVSALNRQRTPAADLLLKDSVVLIYDRSLPDTGNTSGRCYMISMGDYMIIYKNKVYADSLKAELEKYYKDTAENNKLWRSLNEELDLSKAGISDKQMKLDEFSQTLSDKNKKLSELQNYSKRLKNKEAELNKISDKTTDVNNQIKDTRNSYRTTTQEISDLQDEITNINTSIESYTKEIVSDKQVESKLIASFNQQKTETDSIKKRIADMSLRHKYYDELVKVATRPMDTTQINFDACSFYRIASAEVQINRNMMSLRFYICDLKKPDPFHRYIETRQYLINLKKDYKQHWFDYSINKNKANEEKLRWVLDDMLLYKANDSTKEVYRNVEYTNSTLSPGKSYTVYKRTTFDYINFIAFLDLYDVLEKQKVDNTGPIQTELAFDVPMFERVSHKSWAFLQSVYGSINLSPLGKSTPYYLQEKTDTTNFGLYSIDVLRNHWLNNNVKFNLIRYNAGIEHQFVSLDLGFRHYMTKIRERNLVDTTTAESQPLPNYEEHVDATLIGPELTLKTEYTIDDWIGFDCGFSYSPLFIQKSQKLDEFLAKNSVSSYNFKDYRKNNELHLLTFELNFYIRPRLKNDNNPSGFFFRYRLYDDLGTNRAVHHQAMIGYAANIQGLLR